MLLAIALTSGTMFAAEVAEAKRLGGGKTFGRQSSNVTQREALPPQSPQRQSASPAQQAQQPAGATAAAGSQASRSRWLAPIAGIAAGLGLAALASHLGLSEELASVMLLMLLAVGVIFLVRMIAARRSVEARPAMQPAYASTGVGTEATVRYSPVPEHEAAGGSAASAPVVKPAVLPAPTTASWSVPQDFDAEGFVRNAKLQFVRLQTAYDTGNLDELSEFTTPQMFDEIRSQIAGRDGAANVTDVVRLDAQLLGIESSAAEYMASVRFYGLVRESEASPAQSFDEVWNLTKPADGSGGWVLAGIQQLN